MCGIAGYWHFRSGRPADDAVLRAMVRSLQHRGPDDEGCWVDGSMAMGMRRLKVVDLAGGRQPMSNENQTIRVVFNGEIYNHAELRRQLEVCGHRFRSRSDTEVIVHGYEQWGPDCVTRFNGMFALAVWDAARQRLLLVRDRLGIKPLYVYEGPEGVAFGSELKALVAAPWIPIEWDTEAVDDFLTYEFVPAPRTIVRDVRKMMAGTWTLYDRASQGPPRTHRYWRLTARDAPRCETEAEQHLREILEQAVKRRLMADVPLGAFLSGGIDSSIIVALMSGRGARPTQSFSMGFADPSYNELTYARTVAKRYATDHREETVTPRAGELAARVADCFDEPFGDVSAFPTFMISEMARQEVTVILSGDGADELFAGYDAYRAHRWAQRLSPLHRLSGWRAIDAALQRLQPSTRKKGAVNKVKRFAEGLRRPEDLEHARWWVFWNLSERQRLYGGDLANELGDRDCFGYYRDRLGEARRMGFGGLQAQLYADVTGYLVDDILVKVDRMSMANSLEARVPYLDHEFVEYAMSIPAEWKLRRGTTKLVLKRAFEGVLPQLVRDRGKEGFSIPMKNWLRGPLKPMLCEYTDLRRTRDRGWFQPKELTRLVSEHVDGKQNHAHRLWCVMALEMSLEGLARRVAQRGSLPAEVVAI